MAVPAVSIQGVAKTWEVEGRTPVRALDGLSFEVEQGHICAQGLGERAAHWVRVMAKTGADGLGGGGELFTLLGKAAV